MDPGRSGIMSGIAGFAGGTTIDKKALPDKIVDRLRYIHADRVERWSDDFLAVARVWHGDTGFGAQPLFNSRKTFFIMMEGEIFGYEREKEALIKKGFSFARGDDCAEYCLRLYEDRGEEAFKNLNGSFLLLIYKTAENELLLVNDRLSTYPLFYRTERTGALSFATQLSSILHGPLSCHELDMASLFEFFTFKKVLGERTFYKKIKILPPATILRYKAGDISLTPYWERSYINKNLPENYYVESLRDGIERSVCRRTKGGRRFGVLLSGGLDSRTVLTVSRKGKVAFTVGDFRNREVKAAEAIAKKNGCKHVFLKRGGDHYADLMDAAVEIGSGMHLFFCAHNIGFFERIRQECDTLLHGYLFDTLFKGWSVPAEKVNIAGRSVALPFLQKPFSVQALLNASLYVNGVERIFAGPHARKYKDSIMCSLDTFLQETKNNGSSQTGREFDHFAFPSAFKQIDYLYALHNRAYLNERTVAIDNDLLDLYLETPVALRMNGRIFKKASRRLCPHMMSYINSNTGLPAGIPDLPEWLIIKSASVFKKIFVGRKEGLPHPSYTHSSWPDYAELIRYNKKLRRSIEDAINDPEQLHPAIFDIKNIKKMYEDHMNRKACYTALLYLLLTFGRWHKRYGR